ncbi:MAG: SH3 domain-containing protein [Anaerolineae bacterium]|nr:SH3 domain-containing protein [Anaerolineae bacterium]
MFTRIPGLKSAGRWLLAATLILAATLPGTVQAQGSISYGSGVTGSLTSAAPFAIYRFSGNAGDQITAQVVGLTRGLIPSLSLLGPDQRQVAISDDNPFSPEGGNTALITHRLARTGVYALLVTSREGVLGDFALALDGQAAGMLRRLAVGAPVMLDLPPGSPPVDLVFTGSPNAALTLSLATNSPGFAFLAQVFGPTGRLIAGLDGDALSSIQLTLQPTGGNYSAIIRPVVAEIGGTLTVALTVGATGALLPTVAPLPSPTPFPTPTSVLPPTPFVCRVTPSASVNVNVRTGPGTNYPAIGSLFVGNYLDVIGRNAEGTWWVVNLGGRQGWVSGSVTRTEGPCGGLAVIIPPPSPTPAPTSTAAVPQIAFTVNGVTSVTIAPGQCVTVAWDVNNVQAVYYEGQGVAGQGSRQECPAASRTYTLRVILRDNSEVLRTVSVNVGVAGTLDFSAPPTYGSITLNGGFVPDPRTVGITSGGPINVGYLGGNCQGFARSNPDFSVQYNNPAGLLRFYFIGGGDTTLVINAPNGAWYCDDDGLGYPNPQILFGSPAAGRYDIWVASWSADQFIAGTLYISEISP